MIDRVLITSEESAIIIYYDRTPIRITSQGMSIVVFMRWLVAKTQLDYREFNSAVSMENEDTQEIVLKKAS